MNNNLSNEQLFTQAMEDLVNHNFDSGFETLEHLAALHYPDALNELASDLYYGFIIKANPTRCFNLFNELANLEDGRGYYGLGVCYEFGNGVTKNLYEAKSMFLKAVELGDNRGYFDLGVISTRGFEQQDYFRRGAELGNKDCLYRRGLYFVTPNYSGQSNSHINYFKGYACFKKARELGHIDARFRLGMLYYNGNLVEKNPLYCLKYFNEATDRGDYNGYIEMYYLYKNGRNNVLDKYYKCETTIQIDRIRAIDNLNKVFEHGGILNKEEYKNFPRKEIKLVNENLQILDYIECDLGIEPYPTIEDVDDLVTQEQYDNYSNNKYILKDKDSLFKLGICELNGLFSYPRIKEGIDTILMAIKLGNSKANTYLAKYLNDNYEKFKDMYILGQSSEKFRRTLLTNALDLDDPDGLILAAINLYTFNDPKRKEILNRACEMGSVRAMEELGDTYNSEYSNPKDIASAIKYYEMGAKLNSLHCIAALYKIYSDTLNPSFMDETKYYEYLIKGSKLRDANAMSRLIHYCIQHNIDNPELREWMFIYGNSRKEPFSTVLTDNKKWRKEILKRIREEEN